MCTFYDSHSNPEEVKKAFNVDLIITHDHQPSYNIRPTNQSYVILNNEEEKRDLHAFGFGLIPSWAKDKNRQYSTMNARKEELMESNLWRPCFQKRRCIIPANGFYEHHHLSSKIDIPGAPKPTDKVPYYFRLKKEELFGFAGLYDEWTDPNSGEVISTFALITTEANPMVRKIHNKKERMPVILPKEDYAFWLDHSINPADYFGQNIFAAYPEDGMQVWQITKQLDYKQDNEELIMPVDHPIDLENPPGQQGGLFKK